MLDRIEHVLERLQVRHAGLRDQLNAPERSGAMRHPIRGLICASCAAVAMLLVPATTVVARDGCEIGFCLDERAACVSDCGRYGVAEFSCYAGSGCSSICRCQHY
jgi:hypothetical protein